MCKDTNNSRQSLAIAINFRLVILNSCCKFIEIFYTFLLRYHLWYSWCYETFSNLTQVLPSFYQVSASYFSYFKLLVIFSSSAYIPLTRLLSTPNFRRPFCYFSQSIFDLDKHFSGNISWPYVLSC